MSPLHLMVDAERLLVAWLKAQPEVAAIVAGRVATELPSSPTWPLLRLERIGGLPLPLGRARHVDRARIQLEAWGRGTAGQRQPAPKAKPGSWPRPS